MSTLSVDTIQSTGSAVTINDNLTVSTDLNVTGVGYLNGNVVLGNASADTVDVKGEIISNLIPDTDGAYALGSSSKKWSTIHVSTLNVSTVGDGTGVVKLHGTTVQVTGAVETTSTLTVAGNVTASANLFVEGNLTVNGASSTINSTTITVDDPIITLGGDAAPGSDDDKDRGVEFRYHNGTTAKVGFFGFDDSTGFLTYIPDATNTSEVFSGTVGSLDIAGIDTTSNIALDADGGSITFLDAGVLAMTVDVANKRLGINRTPAAKTLEVGGDSEFFGSIDIQGYELILDADGDTSITADTDDQIDFKVGSADQFSIVDGAIIPTANNDISLGSVDYAFANVFTNDLHLKNDRGDWTIVEEEDYLSIRNNKNGKTYKFVLEEV